MTPEDVERARRLRYDKGWTYARIGAEVGFTGQSIRRALDPEYAVRRREQINLNRKSTAKSVVGEYRGSNAEHVSVKADAAARLAEIPPDTRDLTQRFCGDPIPGDPRRPWRKEPSA